MGTRPPHLILLSVQPPSLGLCRGSEGVGHIGDGDAPPQVVGEGHQDLEVPHLQDCSQDEHPGSQLLQGAWVGERSAAGAGTLNYCSNVYRASCFSSLVTVTSNYIVY